MKATTKESITPEDLITDWGELKTQLLDTKIARTICNIGGHATFLDAADQLVDELGRLVSTTVHDEYWEFEIF